MQTEIKRRPARPNAGLLLGTALTLALVFAVILGLYFVLSSFTPALLGQCVAVVNVDMPLSVEGAQPSLLGGGGYPGSEELALTIESLDSREDVGAVVFVINSGGGSVVATREIYDSVKALQKPKVSYFREIAASGAYYVASGTDYIVSDPDALTGSIGVVTTVTSMEGLFEKLGINATSITSGTYKDIGSPYRNMTSDERAIFQGIVDEIYSEFRAVVLENRGKRLNAALFNNVSDGRVMTGRQAYKVGLVDQLGTKRDAITKAADLANISYQSPGDIRICPVQTTVSEPGLFSMEGFVRTLQAASASPSVAFK
ncbi:signal peptide peptidase SppA [Candidatus Micrarchaeota archaeon]|nr:signal peptide peptidase SppA [Candidatus Micrarchaeota archaeon]